MAISHTAQVESTTRLTPNSCQPITANPQTAFLIDVAGEDESVTSAPGETVSRQTSDLANPTRDSTALTIVEVDLSTLGDELINAPRYLVRHRKLWTGTRHTTLDAQIKALVELWQPQHFIIDATGVSAGLASFLEKAFPALVIPFLFTFTSTSKSKLGWDILAVIETGRFKAHIPLCHPEWSEGSPSSLSPDHSPSCHSDKRSEEAISPLNRQLLNANS